jgi:RNA polymerase sigma factor (TIGR02999 family)
MSEPSQDRERLDRLVASLYETLRKLAGGALRDGDAQGGVSPTELVHECYLQLARSEAAKGLGPHELVALASRAIRNILVDRARERAALKRGGGMRRVTLSGELLALAGPIDLLALDVALQKLARIDERQSRVVELRFFGGLTHAEIAQLLGCSPRTVNTEWAMARAWLHRELEEG